MSNALYPQFKEQLLNKLFDLDTDTIKAALVDGSDYTYAATHTSYTTHVPATAVATNGLSGALGSPTIASGVFDTADFTWTTVSNTGSNTCNYIVLEDNSVSDRLVAYYDSFVSGMPVVPNGGDIAVVVSTNGWFAL